MRAPGILSLHATTYTNAVHYEWQHCRDEELRKLLLLQNVSFLPLFRGNKPDEGQRLDELEPVTPRGKGADAVSEIFADISSGETRLLAARKMLGYLNENRDPKAVADSARRLIFAKG